MRLIDADALLKRMQEDPLFYLVERYGVSGVINAEPTIDAEPVIRCKNCHWHYGTICRRNNTMFWEDEDFCSLAERKEE